MNPSDQPGRYLREPEGTLSNVDFDAGNATADDLHPNVRSRLSRRFFIIFAILLARSQIERANMAPHVYAERGSGIRPTRF